MNYKINSGAGIPAQSVDHSHKHFEAMGESRRFIPSWRTCDQNEKTSESPYKIAKIAFDLVEISDQNKDDSNCIRYLDEAIYILRKSPLGMSKYSTTWIARCLINKASTHMQRNELKIAAKCLEEARKVHNPPVIRAEPDSDINRLALLMNFVRYHISALPPENWTV